VEQVFGTNQKFMRTLESLTAAFLIVLALPLFIVGSLGVIAAGRWPLFRTVSRCQADGSGQLTEFNTGPGRLGRLLEDCNSSYLPSFFKVMAGRARLRDVAFAVERRQP
jgi:hypothetical protein